MKWRKLVALAILLCLPWLWIASRFLIIVSFISSTIIIFIRSILYLIIMIWHNKNVQIIRMYLCILYGQNVVCANSLAISMFHHDYHHFQQQLLH